MAQVVDKEGNTVVQVILPLLDRQMDTQADGGGRGHVERLGVLVMATLHVLTLGTEWLQALSPGLAPRAGSYSLWGGGGIWYKWLWPGLLPYNFRADLDTVYFEICQRCGYTDFIFF